MQSTLPTSFDAARTPGAEAVPERPSRALLALNQVPKPLIDALITTEDRKFYTHWGIDPRGIARANPGTNPAKGGAPWIPKSRRKSTRPSPG